MSEKRLRVVSDDAYTFTVTRDELQTLIASVAHRGTWKHEHGFELDAAAHRELNAVLVGALMGTHERVA